MGRSALCKWPERKKRKHNGKNKAEAVSRVQALAFRVIANKVEKAKKPKLAMTVSFVGQ